MGYLFISYSRKNVEFAQRVAQELQVRGYTIWIDTEDLDPSENWNNQIERAINEAEALIALLSPDAVNSRTVQNEIDLADAIHKPIIPVLIHPTYVPAALVNHQIVDATGDWDAFVDNLVKAIDASMASLRMRTVTMNAVQPRTMPMTSPPAAVRAQKSAAPLGLLRAVLIAAAVVLVILLLMMAAGPTIGYVFDDITSGLESAPASGHIRATATTTPLPTATIITTATDQTIRPTADATAMNAMPQTATALAAALQPTSADSLSTDDGNNNTKATEIAFYVQGTVTAFSATESSVLSPAEAAQLVSLTSGSNSASYLSGILAALALGISIGALVVFWRSGERRLPRRTGHSSAHHGASLAHPEAVLPEKMLEDYHIFTSSSEKDKDWVRMLVDDLEALGYLVWWYAKDAPGLPFGNEIRSAIYHTKVFLIVVSPDSMRSKHIEEEIRWAEIYDRPIVPVVCRSTTIEERLYGLAKGADINFTDDYKEALEFLAQAIDHHLQQRMEKMEAAAREAKEPQDDGARS